MLTQISHATIEAAEETQAPMPIRIIRKVNGRHEYVVLQSEAELTDDERRAAYVAMFNPCGLA